MNQEKNDEFKASLEPVGDIVNLISEYIGVDQKLAFANLSGELFNGCFPHLNRYAQSRDQIFLGLDHTFMLVGGVLYGCGGNDFGQLGLEDMGRLDTWREIKVPALQEPIVEVATHGSGTCTFIRSASNRVFFWGSNGRGRLGLGSSDNSNISITELKLPDPQQLVGMRLVPSHFSNFSLSADGILYVCGANGYGELGLGHKMDCTIWTEVSIPDSQKVMAVMPGKYRTFIRTVEAIYACGANFHGMLGVGDSVNRSVWTEVKIPGLRAEVADISVGDEHTLTLAGDGTLYGCGNNQHGELGLGDLRNRETWTEIKIPGLRKIKKVLAGNQASFILTTDGTVLVCGLNNYGKLGLGNELVGKTISTWTEVKISGLQGPVEDVFLGGGHTVIRTADDRWYSCGNNCEGQLCLKKTKNIECIYSFTEIPHPFPALNEFRWRYRLLLQQKLSGYLEMFLTRSQTRTSDSLDLSHKSIGLVEAKLFTRAWTVLRTLPAAKINLQHNSLFAWSLVSWQHFLSALSKNVRILDLSHNQFDKVSQELRQCLTKLIMAKGIEILQADAKGTDQKLSISIGGEGIKLRRKIVLDQLAQIAPELKNSKYNHAQSTAFWLTDNYPLFAQLAMHFQTHAPKSIIFQCGRTEEGLYCLKLMGNLAELKNIIPFVSQAETDISVRPG